MITTKILTATGEVRDSKTQRALTFEVSPSKIQLFNGNGEDEFMFRNANSPKIRSRWRNVLQLMSRAITEAERLTDQTWPKHVIHKK